jgi:hypothetical protein
MRLPGRFDDWPLNNKPRLQHADSSSASLVPSLFSQAAKSHPLFSIACSKQANAKLRSLRRELFLVVRFRSALKISTKVKLSDVKRKH